MLTAQLGAYQIPHADDHCNRELFGVCHLLPGQVISDLFFNNIIIGSIE